MMVPLHMAWSFCCMESHCGMLLAWHCSTPVEGTPSMENALNRNAKLAANGSEHCRG